MLKDVTDRLVRLEAARDARADEREKGTAKGLDFEDAVEARLDALLRGTGDLVEPTGTAVGNSVRSRKGDFLITLDPSWTRGVPLCVAVEAKSGRVGLALAAARDHADVVDAAAVRRDLDGIRAQLNAIAGMKAKLTSISTATGDVRNSLDALRQGVMDRVISIEANVADVSGHAEVA